MSATARIGAGLGRWWRRWRAVLVLVPLIAGLGVAAVIGGRMLLAERPERAAPPADVTCWNGDDQPATACPLPQGVRGLQWVFPRFRPEEGGCTRDQRAEPREGTPLQWSCATQVDGSPVTLTYVVRSSVERGLAYVASTYPGVRRTALAGGERLLWRGVQPRVDGRYDLTVAYRSYPYTVLVRAESAALRDRALRQLVRFRPAGQVVVRAAR